MPFKKIEEDAYALDVIQRLKIPIKLVLGFGTGSMKDLNTILRPALDNNQISKEEDQAVRDYRRRYSNRTSQAKKRGHEASQYAILQQSFNQHKLYTIENTKLLEKEKEIIKDLQENLKQKEALQQKYSHLLPAGDEDKPGIDNDFDEGEAKCRDHKAYSLNYIKGDEDLISDVKVVDVEVANLSDDEYQPSSKSFKKALHERFLQESRGGAIDKSASDSSFSGMDLNGAADKVLSVSELQKELEKIKNENKQLKRENQALVRKNAEMSGKIEDKEIMDLWMKIE